MPLNSSLLIFILRANPLDQAIGGLGEAVYKDELFSPEVGDDHTQVARQPYFLLIDLTPSIEYELTTREKGRIRLIDRQDREENHSTLFSISFESRIPRCDSYHNSSMQEPH